MRAITGSGAGGPEVLRWDEVPDPQPRAGEVLVEVAASAVNRADLLQRQGPGAPPEGGPRARASERGRLCRSARAATPRPRGPRRTSAWSAAGPSRRSATG